MTVPAPVNVAGRAAGKVNKVALLRQILQEAQAQGKKWTAAEVLQQAQQRLASYPPEQRQGVRFALDEVRKARETLARQPPPVSAPPGRSPLGRPGKVRKDLLLQRIIEKEMDAQGRIDKARVLLLAQKEIEALPKEQQVTISPASIKHASTKVREARGISVPPGRVPMPVASAPDQAYSARELLSAKRFLNDCALSLSKARALLDLIASLTQGDDS